jgi:hypothetical protein
MRVWVLLSLFLAAATASTTGTGLTPGDAAGIALFAKRNANNFGILLFVPVQNGTTIYAANDPIYGNDDKFRGSGPHVSYTAPTSLAAGTVLQASDFSGSLYYDNFYGGQLIVYQGAFGCSIGE